MTRDHGLTRRQLDVLRLLADGQKNWQIADTLGISPETVKSHVRHIFWAMNVTSRFSAARRAYELGIVTVERVEHVSFFDLAKDLPSDAD